MTATGGFPAPGPQTGEPPPHGPRAAPSATGFVARPQTPMLAAHRPGIVPLRPLLLGDILDGAVKAVRLNPKSMVGLSAIVLAVFLVPSAAVGVVAAHFGARLLSRFGTDAQAFAGIPASLLKSVLTTLATIFLSGVLGHVVGQAVLGRKPDVAATWRSTRGRVPALLALIVLTGLFILLSTAVLIGPGALLMVNKNVGAGLVLLLLGLLGLLVAGLFVSTKISLAAPAMVLEGLSARAGLQRSFALTKGTAFWRILGITMAAGLLAYIATVLLGLPFSIAGVIVAFASGQGSESGQMIQTFVAHLSALLTGAVTIPFVSAVTGLLYIDRRMRLEALDVVLLRESQSNPAPPA